MNALGSVAGGAVIAHLPFDEARYLGSPSIVHSRDGGYLVSHDFFGIDSSTSESAVYASEDGARWEKIADIAPLFWGTLFHQKDALYLIGITEEYGDIVIRRSLDEGRTWTIPHSSTTGLLTSDAGYHTAPVPMLIHAGRLWRAIERRTIAGIQPWGYFAAGVMSAPVDADLLDARSWEYSERIEPSDELLADDVRFWLEGNVALAPNGEVVNVLRAHSWDRKSQRAVLMSVSADGRTVSADADSVIAMPGGGSKFTIRQDGDGRYWSIANTALFDASPHLALRARNTLSLITSADLHTWHVVSVLLHHPDDEKHGYQYVDWQFEGTDIVFACRTSHEFEGRQAHSYHDSNLITFHRIREYESFIAS